MCGVELFAAGAKHAPHQQINLLPQQNAFLTGEFQRFLPAVVLSDAEIVVHAGITGKIITGPAMEAGEKFPEDTKSAIFIKTALKSALRCPYYCATLQEPLARGIVLQMDQAEPANQTFFWHN